MAGASSAAAAASLPRIVVTEDGRRTRLVDEETMRYFLSLPARPPLTMHTYSPELMRRLGLHDGEVDTLLRAWRNAEKANETHADNARGYAYLEIPELYPDDDGMDEQAM